MSHKHSNSTPIGVVDAATLRCGEALSVVVSIESPEFIDLVETDCYDSNRHITVQLKTDHYTRNTASRRLKSMTWNVFIMQSMMIANP